MVDPGKHVPWTRPGPGAGTSGSAKFSSVQSPIFFALVQISIQKNKFF